MPIADTLESFSAGQAATNPGKADAPCNLSGARETYAGISIDVLNTGDYAIRVRARTHFSQVDAALKFDRAAAIGMRLDCVRGTGARFEPGEIVRVHLVRIVGMNNDSSGARLKPSVQHGEVRRRGLRLAF